MKRTFEDLLSGEVPVCWINEPTIDFEVEPLTALQIARERWRIAYLVKMEGANYENRTT